MLRCSPYALLALFVLVTSLSAQEPVFGLVPNDATDPGETMPALDPVDALTAPPPSIDPVSFQAPGVSGEMINGGFADPMPPGELIGGGYGGGCADGSCYSGGCVSCGDFGGFCDCDCGCPQTFWKVRGSGVYMNRVTGDDTRMVLSNVAFAGGQLANARTLINAVDFDLEWEPGFDISLAQADGYGGEVEGRILYLNEFDDRQQATGNNVELMNRILFLGFEPVNTLSAIQTNPVTATADYHSAFRTVELNYREAFTPWWFVSMGFRYANLDEDLLVSTVDSSAVPLTSQTRYITDNDMFGFQMGTDLIIASNPAGWEFVALFKGGVYYNRIDLEVGSQGDGFVNGRGSDVRAETAWLGEANFQLRKHLSCNGTLTLGYSMISIDGVALAPEQMTTVINPLDGPDLQVASNRGTAFYHGLNAGIEFRW